MATENKEIVSTLNGLVETLKDGEKGFTTAAEKAKDSSLKSLFMKYASQRAQYATELQGLVAQFGGDPASGGHVGAALHRGWMGLKEALSKNEDKALIDECEAGEDAAVKAYRDAIAKGLPPQVLSVVEKQFSGIQQAHGVIRDLKHGVTSRTATTV
jgi:uncharacterized protein (TIGR02284 family)